MKRRFAIVISARMEFLCYADGLCPRQTIEQVAAERGYLATALHAEVI